MSDGIGLKREPDLRAPLWQRVLGTLLMFTGGAIMLPVLAIGTVVGPCVAIVAFMGPGGFWGLVKLFVTASAIIGVGYAIFRLGQYLRG